MLEIELSWNYLLLILHPDSRKHISSHKSHTIRKNSWCLNELKHMIFKKFPVEISGPPFKEWVGKRFAPELPPPLFVDPPLFLNCNEKPVKLHIHKHHLTDKTVITMKNMQLWSHWLDPATCMHLHRFNDRFGSHFNCSHMPNHLASINNSVCGWVGLRPTVNRTENLLIERWMLYQLCQHSKPQPLVQTGWFNPYRSHDHSELLKENTPGRAINYVSAD